MQTEITKTQLFIGTVVLTYSVIALSRAMTNAVVSLSGGKK